MIPMTGYRWFATDYDYSGPAQVVFEDPPAEFVGKASVRPDECGG
jgi:hypothetical protein